MKIDRSFLYLIATSLLSSLLMILSSFLLARLLSVEERGALLLFVAAVSYVATLGAGGVGFAISLSMRQQQYGHWQVYIGLSLLYCLLASYVALYFTAFQSFAFFFIFNVLLTAIFTISLEKSKIEANMATYRLLVLQQPSLALLFYGICYLFWGEQPLHLVLTLLTLIGVLQAIFCLYYLQRLAKKFVAKSGALQPIQAKFFLQTWFKQNAFQLFGATVTNLDKFLIALFMGNYVLGLYAVCLAFDALLTRFINSLSDYYHSGLLNQLNRLKPVLGIIGLMTLGCLIFVPLLAEPVIKLFFGEKYLSVAPILLLFIINAICAGLAWLLSQPLLILGKQFALLLRQIISIGVFCAVFYWLRQQQLLGVAYALLSGSITRLLISIIYYYRYPIPIKSGQK